MVDVLRITDGFKTTLIRVLCDERNGNNLSKLKTNNEQEFDFICSLLFNLINNIIILFHVNNVAEFEKKIIGEGKSLYRDIWGLFYLLLPFISNKDQLSQIGSLNDLYITKEPSSVNADPEKSMIKFKFTNVQYSRCDLKNHQFIPFNRSHLEHNYRLLISTIQTISHRMYVNWSNIVPVNDFHELSVFIGTQLAIDNKTFLPDNGLPTIDNIINYKHLFVGTIYETIYHHLYKSVKNIKWLLYDVRIDEQNVLKYDDDDKISDNMMNVYQYLLKNNFLPMDRLSNDIAYKELTLDEVKTFDNKWTSIIENKHLFLLTNIITAFEKYYHDASSVKPLKVDTLLFNVQGHRISIREIPFEHIYEFMRQSINQFKKTVYFKIPEIADIQLNEKDITKPSKVIVTYKNIFNFAKSFCCHFQLGYPESQVLMHPRWDALSDEERNIIIKRLNGVNNNWFNIRGNLASQYGIAGNSPLIAQLNDYVFQICRKNIPTLVFTCLSYAGLLSQFTAKPLDTRYDIQNYRNCYYYLTETQYGSMTTYDEVTKKQVSYIQFNTSTDGGRRWYNAYAMDWISQINFFHRYINNRVIFVTGGTGVGKSTQIPKLLMYATKMIDWKSDGRVVDTQPRRKPTVDNANRVSLELGVSIIKEEIDKKQTETDNYGVQYKTSERKHSRNNSGNLTLKFQTDQILLNELSNPIMKVMRGNSYTSKNMYDIIVVDESHEHNPNMDMILTRMRDVLYYNNDCRLVIVSATMDDDEPIYRRYYRNINDNLIYPPCRTIENQVDRINVDRRLDISIPNQLNNFVIREQYFNNVPVDVSADKVRNILILKIIGDRLKDPKTKDILVFKSGKREISDCVEIINASTPSSVIAIPYYSDLTQELREFLEKVPSNKNNLKINKKDTIGEGTTINDLKVGEGAYTHIILVATNIVEASITIDTLTDVIDEGIRKIPIYSPLHNGTVLKKGYISEQSRKQRRGRVGRTGDGNVFYLYKSNALENVLNAYAICISDVTNILLSLLKTEDTRVVFDSQNDPNRLTINSMDDNKKGIFNMIRDQYFIHTLNGGQMTFQRYAYKGIQKQYDYDYEYSQTIPQKYENGYEQQYIFDKEGIFYIIHPNEMNMKRNMFGTIVEQPSEERISLHMRKLTDLLFVIRDDNQLIMTNYGGKIYKLTQKLFLNTNGAYFTIACCFAKIYGCLEDVIKIITMLSIVGSELPDCPTECSSDLIVLLQVMNKMLSVQKCFDGYGEVDKTNQQIKTCILQHTEPKQQSLYFKCISAYHNTLVELSDEKTNKLFTECTDFLNADYIASRSASLQLYERITLSFLHAFGYNIIKKIGDYDLYVPMKYPIRSNVKEIEQNIKRQANTCVQPIYRANYMFYINLRVTDSDKQFVNSIVSSMHYVNPSLLEHISYQHDLSEYISRVTSDNKLKTGEKTAATHNILIQYEKVVGELLRDIKVHYRSGTNKYFGKISTNSEKILEQKDRNNVLILGQ